jgi:hypothetical protein
MRGRISRFSHIGTRSPYRRARSIDDGAG